MPNRSNTSRSYQLAVRQTPVTESISGCDSCIQHFSRSRRLRVSECRKYTTSKRGSAGSQSTPVMPLKRTNCCCSLRNLQTSTIPAGSTHSVGSWRSACPLTMTPGSAASNADAAGWSFKMSGSILFCGALQIVGTGLGCLLRPIQRALLPDVEKSREDQNNEQQHLAESKQLQLPVHYRPGVKEDRFDIEKDENDGHQVKLYAESLARRPGGRDARFIGRVLHAIPDAFADQHGNGDQTGRHQDGDGHLDQYREVGIRIRRRHSILRIVNSIFAARSWRACPNIRL